MRVRGPHHRLFAPPSLWMESNNFDERAEDTDSACFQVHVGSRFPHKAVETPKSCCGAFLLAKHRLTGFVWQRHGELYRCERTNFVTPTLDHDSVIASLCVTGEGENYMLILQGARHLLKFYSSVEAGKVLMELALHYLLQFRCS